MSSPSSGERTPARRKWAAIGIATALATGSFWLVLVAFRLWLGDLTTAELQEGVEIPVTTGVAVALAGGFALMAATFVVLALISRRARPWRAAALAWVIGGAMWLWLPFLTGEPVTPMVAGFGAGGVVALRAEPEHTVGRRVAAALLVAVYIYLLVRIAPLIGAIAAPLLPLPVLAWADAMAERRALNRSLESAKPDLRPRRRAR